MRSNDSERPPIRSQPGDPAATGKFRRHQTAALSSSVVFGNSSASEEPICEDVRQTAQLQRTGNATRIQIPIQNSSELAATKQRSLSSLALQTLPFSLQSMPSPDGSGRESPGLAPITRQLLTGSRIPSILTASTGPLRSRADSSAQDTGSHSIATKQLHSPGSSKATSRLEGGTKMLCKSRAASASAVTTLTSPHRRPGLSQNYPRASSAKKDSAAPKSSSNEQEHTPTGAPNREAPCSRARSRGGQLTTMRFVSWLHMFTCLACARSSTPA
jgi:hypothetical protein